jgi:hypothetical protein
MCSSGYNLEQNKYTDHVKPTLMCENEELGLNTSERCMLKTFYNVCTDIPAKCQQKCSTVCLSIDAIYLGYEFKTKGFIPSERQRDKASAH